MHLEVEDEAALLTALAARLLPQDVLQAPVRVERGADRLRLEPERPFAPAVAAALERAGFTLGAEPLLDSEACATWAEVVRCQRVPPPEPPLGEVLFELGPDVGFGALCAELLRLGAVEQRLCTFSDDHGRRRTMVRVTAPSYYVVLRALERDGPTAYARAAGGVWVALGYAHPLAAQVAPAPGHILLVPGEGPWSSPPDGPWTDLAERLDVVWPEDARLSAAADAERLQVELRFEASSRGGPARLWVLRRDGRARLEGLLGALPDGVARGLEVARLEVQPEPLYVLRSPDLGEPPPALDLDAEAYAPRADLPNLYLPLGVALAPPLSTRLLRARLAEAPDELVWVRAGPPLAAERASTSAFRPLPELADYVIDDEAAPLAAWAAGALFDFEAYRGVEVSTTPPREPAPARRGRGRVEQVRAPERAPPKRPAIEGYAPRAARASVAGPDAAAALAAELEQRMADDPPPDDETRRDRWAALGRALAAAGRVADAHQAFARALCSAPGDVATRRAWAEAMPLEVGLGRALTDGAVATPATVAAAICTADEDLDVAAAARWLDGAEGRLPVHLAWLARVALTRRTGADPLGLLRTRDGITLRIEDGLAVGRDAPSLVRRLDAADGAAPAAALRDRLDRLWAGYRATRREPAKNEVNARTTDEYVGLLMRWGHARLGAAEGPDGLEPTQIDADDPVHGAVLALFEARIGQARDGRELGAPLDPEVLGRVEALPAFARFKVERLWLGSLALGGSGSQDVFRRWVSARREAPIPAGLEGRREALDGLLAKAPEAAMAHRALDLLAGLPEAEAAARFARALEWSERLPESAALTVQEELLSLAGHLDRPELAAAAARALEPHLLAEPARGAAVLGRRARVFARAGLADVLRARVAALSSVCTGHDVPTAQARIALALALAATGDDAAVPREMGRAEGLLQQSLRNEPHLALVRALALALARTSGPRAIAGVEQLAPRLALVGDMYSTNSHYCVSVLHFMESMVLALTGRDLTIGPKARAWLDEDEARLRARMHADLRGDRP